MKRRVIQRRVVVLLLLLLAGGAIVNVAVAWGCDVSRLLRSLNSSGQGGMGALQTEELWRNSPKSLIEQVPVDVRDCFPESWAVLQRHASHFSTYWRLETSFGRRTFKYGVTEQFPGAFQMGPNRFVHVQSSGWPITCIRCVGTFDGLANRLPQPLLHAVNWKGGWSAKTYRDGFWRYNYSRPLPVTPVLPGFAINTIFYAAMLWVLFFVPGKLKRTLRRRRGLCPACAYPVGTSPVCTECGAAVKPIGTTDATPGGE